MSKKLTMEDLGTCEVLKDDSTPPDLLFKAIVIGDAGVGKSCILHRAVTNEFKDEYEVTIGAEFSSLVVKIRDKVVQLQVWDTAGQENFRSMIRVFYKNSHAAFLVYDLTRRSTFEKLGDWIADVRANALPNVKMMLVGNQKDRESNREVTVETATDFVTKNDIIDFRETSAKTGEGVINIFVKMAKALYLETENAQKQQEQPRGGKLVAAKPDGKKKACC